MTTDSLRSEARRAQILTAASDCFRRHGFHGASIAKICKEAGMSAGHIYHYFDNKEAIIAAIVAQDLDRLLQLSEELRTAHNVLQTVSERATSGVREHLDPAEAGLKLEIVTEASRNPCIASIVRDADRQCRDNLRTTLRELRRNLGCAEDEVWLSGLVELFAAMFDGLLVRAVRNPELDQDQIAEMFRRVILEQLVSSAAPPWQAPPLSSPPRRPDAGGLHANRPSHDAHGPPPCKPGRP